MIPTGPATVPPPEYRMVRADVMCGLCGAVVADSDLHTAWHEQR
jgi:hypothetical protein